MGTGTRTVTLLAALALVVAGCSSGGDDSGGGEGATPLAVRGLRSGGGHPALLADDADVWRVRPRM